MSFRDIVDELRYGGPLEDTEEAEDNPEDPDKEPDEGQPHSEPDTPEEDPEPESEPPAEEDEESEADESEDVEPEGDAEPEEESEEEDEGAEEAEEPPAEDTFADRLPDGFALTDDGEIVAGIQGADEPVPISELPRGYLRQADYTRKTQELARQREQLEKRFEESRDLAEEIAASENMQAFLKENPEALPYLLSEPEDTRELIRSPKALEEFWQTYEVIQDNPNLREKFLSSPEESPEEDPEVQAVRTQRAIQQVAADVTRAVEHVAQDFSDVERDDVIRYVMELGGVPEEVTTAEEQQQAVAGFARIAQLIYTSDDRIDTKLIRDRFETLAAQAEARTKREAEKAEKHNEKVEKEVEEQDDVPPKSPPGDAPVNEPEEEEGPEDFASAVQDILYGS